MGPGTVLPERADNALNIMAAPVRSMRKSDLFPESDFAVVLMANAGFAEMQIRPLWEAIYDRYLGNSED